MAYKLKSTERPARTQASSRFRISFYPYKTMQYHDQLHPWVVYRRLPNCQNIAVARFRRRNEAEMYLISLRRLMPNAQFLIAFDPPSDRPSASPTANSVKQQGS